MCPAVVINATGSMSSTSSVPVYSTLTFTSSAASLKQIHRSARVLRIIDRMVRVLRTGVAWLVLWPAYSRVGCLVGVGCFGLNFLHG